MFPGGVLYCSDVSNPGVNPQVPSVNSRRLLHQEGPIRMQYAGCRMQYEYLEGVVAASSEDNNPSTREQRRGDEGLEVDSIPVKCMYHPTQLL